MQYLKKMKGKQIITFLLSLILIFSITTQTIFAATGVPSIVSVVNSISLNGGNGGKGGYTNGVSESRTGYLVYMVNKETGAKTSAERKYLCSSLISGTIDITNGRRGGSGTNAGAPPWGLTPWNYASSSSVISNEPEIKEWFKTNGHDYVKKTFPANLANYETDTEVLVVETLMNFQFQDTLGKGSAGELTHSDEEYRSAAIKLLTENGTYTDNQIMAKFKIKKSDPSSAAAVHNIQKGLVKSMITRLKNERYLEDGASNKHYDSPYLGTVPNLIDKRLGLPNSAGFADSYLKDVAPRSEYIKKAEAGFQNWTGPFPMSFDDVKNYGVAMIIVHCMDSAQTTCDEPLIPNPHDPPDESDGKKTIIKNYRTRNLTTGKLTEDGNTFIREEVSADILIEDEDKYVVVGWATSSGKSFITSPTWESAINGTGTITQRGKSSGSVNLTGPVENTLYVLLEKPEDETPKEEPYNWLLTQSMITRTVWENYPDNKLGMELIKDHEFKWTAPAHDKCAPYDCTHTFENNDGKEETQTWTLIHGTNADEDYEYDDIDIKFSIYNDKCESYPDIHATKKNGEWAREFFHGKQYVGEEKRWEPKIPPMGWSRDCFKFKRDKNKQSMLHAFKEDSYASKSQKWEWEYVCVLMRGKDKLTVAEWANNGDAFYDHTEANDNLAGMSSSGFTVGNVKSGTRKSDTYYEKFNMNFVQDGRGDYETTVTPRVDTNECGYCGKYFAKHHTTFSSEYKLDSPMSVNNIVVRIETYSGNPSGGYADTTLDDSEIIVKGNSISTEGFKSGLQNTHSGRMVYSGGSISFLPYILMKYQTEPSGRAGWPDTYKEIKKGWLKAYVLGQYYRSIIPNDYAEINWTKKSNPNMTLTSNQWSVHAEAIASAAKSGTHSQWNPKSAWKEAEDGTNDVLPGGVTLGLTIKEPDRQHIFLTTFQCYVDGKGKNQCEITGGTTGESDGMSLADAQGNHQGFVAEYASALDNTNVQQWQTDKITSTYAWDTGIKVNRGESLSGTKAGTNKNGTGFASDEEKYYFGEVLAGSNKGDYDVDVKATKTHTYTFTSDVNGQIHMYIDNVNPTEHDSDAGAYSSTANIINERTGVRDKLIAAVEQSIVPDDNTRGGNKHSMYSDDKTALNADATGGKWYNEAFDGITVVVQETEIVSGFIDPAERTEVIDPRLTQEQKAKSNMFAEGTFEMDQFRTRDYSENYRKHWIMSSFKNKYVQMKDLEWVFWTRRFLIPNTTVQDLY